MGAIDIQGRWRSTAPVGDVWGVINDLATWPDWWPAIRSVEAVAPLPDALQTARLTFDTHPPIPTLVATVAVVERNEPDHLLVEVRDGPLAGHGEVTVSEDPAGSITSYAIELRVRSLLFRPLEPILRSATRSSGRERLERAGADLAQLAGGLPLSMDGDPPS
ncbi:MAG: SRPBCC family protein [Nitriliruptoraceae bacterium]